MENSPPVRPPYNRVKGETAKAFAAFISYRDIPSPERSVEEAARKHGKSPGTMNRWARRWHWVSRARAWDEHLDDLARAQIEKDRADMIRRHLSYRRAQQTVGIAVVRREMKRIDQKEGTHPDLPFGQGMAAINDGISGERLLFGEPTERVESDLTATVIPIEKLIDDETFQKLSRLTLDRLYAVAQHHAGMVRFDGIGDEVAPGETPDAP